MKKRLVRLSGVAFGLLFIGVAVLALRPQLASAASDCDGWYGRACFHGYFTDGYDTSGLNVIDNGIPGVTTKAAFIATIEGHLSSGNAHEITAAQFIILSMLGNNGGIAKSVSAAQLADWESRVNNPAVQMIAETALFECGIANSYYQVPPLNDIAAGTATPIEGCGNPADKMIDFKVNGVLVYRIRVACANPLGKLPGLPPPPPATTAACSNSTFPASMAVGQPQSFRVYVNISRPFGPPLHIDADPNTSDPKMYVTVNDPNGRSLVQGNKQYDAGPSGNAQSLQSESIAFTPQTSGRYTLQWGLTGSLNVSCGFNAPGGGSPNEGTAAYQPYFSVLGGDIAAGPGYGTGASCTPTPDAFIKGWNNNNGSGGGYYGAGGQLGVLALGDITSFPSAQSAVIPSTARPSGLAFANTSANIPAGKYGGGYGKPNWCVPDYVQAVTSGLGGPIVTTAGKRTYVLSGNTTIPALNLSPGANITIKVTGDVYLSGDIKYLPYSSASDIPQLRLLVSGNIYIGNLVSELHGFYDAQPGGAGSGTIHTCAPAPGVSSNAYATCNRQLTVYGAVSAAHLELERTYGSLVAAGATPAAPAERFIFTPELWIAGRGGSSGSVGGSAQYQSITSLPPVL